MSTYRVFVSYSHDDLPLARGIVQILHDNGCTPMWDQDFAFGHGFHEQIRDFIAHSHVFLPILTPTSSQRGWVHEEIGYALALNVPVLPVAVGALPGQMIEQLHAVQMREDIESLRVPLSLAVVEQLVIEAAVPSLALSQCAQVEEERSMLNIAYARGVLRLGAHGRVRQRQGLSTFAIPDKAISHPLWKDRYGALSRSAFHCEHLRDERLALGEHARHAGCSLILDVSRSFDRYGTAVRISRLKVLRDFLMAMPDESVQVVITKIPIGESLLIVGDWFSAESLSSKQGEGYRQTVFIRHAPNMKRKIDDFDSEMDYHLSAAGIKPGTSRGIVVGQLNELIGQLEKGGTA